MYKTFSELKILLIILCKSFYVRYILHSIYLQHRSISSLQTFYAANIFWNQILLFNVQFLIGPNGLISYKTNGSIACLGHPFLLLLLNPPHIKTRCLTHFHTLAENILRTKIFYRNRIIHLTHDLVYGNL